MNQENEHVAAWSKRICDENLPILGYTISEITSAVSDDYTPRSALAGIILRDSSMTAQVLKLANSAYYGARGEKMSTISRAILVLGVDSIKNICLTTTIIGELLKGHKQTRVLDLMAQSFHAAIQARELAKHSFDAAPEEVFIATLLFKLGEIAFWCFGGKTAEELNMALESSTLPKEDVEMKVLGFRLSDLTVGLATRWRLSDLTIESLASSSVRQKRVQPILLGHKLAQAVENGWQTPAIQNVMQDITKLTGISHSELTSMLHQNAREAINIACAYGAGKAACKIPLPPELQKKVETGIEQVEQEPAHEERVTPKRGAEFVNILRDLTYFVTTDSDVSAFLGMVLEGIFRGVGMDRALFALLTPDRKTLIGKSSVGDEKNALLKTFQISTGANETNLFSAVLEFQEPCWMPDNIPDSLQTASVGSITYIVGDGDFFVAPAVVNGKSIGLFYADRRMTGDPLDAESFDHFRHITLQASVLIELLKRKGK